MHKKRPASSIILNVRLCHPLAGMYVHLQGRAEIEPYDQQAITKTDHRQAVLVPVHPGYCGHIEDVDFDGDMDLLFHFNTQDTGIQPGDTEATMWGQTYGGEDVWGTGPIRTVPPR